MKLWAIRGVTIADPDSDTGTRVVQQVIQVANTTRELAKGHTYEKASQAYAVLEKATHRTPRRRVH